MLLVFDVSDPGAIVPRGSIAVGNPAAVAVQNGIVFVSDHVAKEIVAIDASDPDLPVSRGSIPAHNADKIVVQGPYAYWVGGNTDLHTIDVSDPDNLQAVSSTPAIDIGGLSDVAVQGDTAWVLSVSRERLVALDVSDPASVQTLDLVPTVATQPNNLSVSGNRACLTGQSSDLIVVFDISDPTDPQLLYSTNNGLVSPSDVVVQGNAVVVVDHNTDLLSVFDISSTAAITLHDSVDIGTNTPIEVAVQGGFAYTVTLNPDRLTVLEFAPRLSIDGSLQIVRGDLRVRDGAVVAPEFRWPAPRTLVKQVSASAFVPKNPSEGYNREAGYLYPSGDTDLQLHAPFHLPQGATITRMSAFFSDSGSADFTDIDVRLRHVPNTGLLTPIWVAQILNKDTVGITSGRQEFETTNTNQPVIDNESQAYSFDVDFTVTSATSALRFYGVRVEYTMAGP